MTHPDAIRASLLKTGPHRNLRPVIDKARPTTRFYRDDGAFCKRTPDDEPSPAPIPGRNRPPDMPPRGTDQLGAGRRQMVQGEPASIAPGAAAAHRQALDAIAEALMVEPDLGRARLDEMLIGVFDPRRDHAAEFIARLRAGPSQAVQDFATPASFERQGGRMQPTN